MFYQLEREYILHRLLTTKEEHEQNPDTANQTALFENDPLMPARYRSLPLRADWYISGKSKKPSKRKHRKSHGKIGFLELTRLIASRWGKVDDETRKYCKMMAAMELVKYKEDMESYNLYKEHLSAIGEIPEDMKERMAKKKRAQEKRMAGKKAGGATTVSSGRKGSAAPIVADTVSSNPFAMTTRSATITTMPKLEPIAHNSPHDNTGNIDNDMEQFISSLVHSPAKPKAKVITPERKPKKCQVFRAKASLKAGSAAASAAGNEFHIPLKDHGDDHLDGIKMAFSGIDENEIEREFSLSHRGQVSSPKATTGLKSFDYWDVLVESPV